MVEQIEKLTPDLLNDKVNNVFSFYVSEIFTNRDWKIKLKKKMISDEIAQVLQKSLQDFGHVNSIEIINSKKGVGSHSFGFTLKLDYLYKGKIIKVYTPEGSSISLGDILTDEIYIKVNINLFSDYLRNKKTGEIKDFSSFAYKNRERLETFLKRFEQDIDGEIIDLLPHKGEYREHWTESGHRSNDWAAEEMWKYGFLPMSHLKDEYEKQKKKKGLLGWIFNR